MGGEERLKKEEKKWENRRRKKSDRKKRGTVYTSLKRITTKRTSNTCTILVFLSSHCTKPTKKEGRSLESKGVKVISLCGQKRKFPMTVSKRLFFSSPFFSSLYHYCFTSLSSLLIFSIPFSSLHFISFHFQCIN